MNRKNNQLYLPNLCTLVAKTCALLIAIFCALLLTDYTPEELNQDTQISPSGKLIRAALQIDLRQDDQ